MQQKPLTIVRSSLLVSSCHTDRCKKSAACRHGAWNVFLCRFPAIMELMGIGYKHGNGYWKVVVSSWFKFNIQSSLDHQILSESLKYLLKLF